MFHNVDTIVHSVDVVDRTSKKIVAELATPNKKATTYYSRLVIDAYNINFQFQMKKHLLTLQKHNMFKKRKKRNWLVNFHSPLNLWHENSSSMNVKKCVPPICFHDLCINLTGQSCALNHHTMASIESKANHFTTKEENSYLLTNVDHGRKRWRTRSSHHYPIQWQINAYIEC